MITNSVIIKVKCGNDLLFLKRSKLESYSGVWEFPAGTIEKNERIEEGAKRELLEETGIDADIKYLGYTERISSKKHIIFHVFVTEIKSSEKNRIFLSEEHDDFRFDNGKNFKKIGIDTINVIKTF